MTSSEYTLIRLNSPKAPISKKLNNLRFLILGMLDILKEKVGKNEHKTDKENFDKGLGILIRFIGGLKFGAKDNEVSQFIAALFFRPLYLLLGRQFFNNPEWRKYWSKNQKFFDLTHRDEFENLAKKLNKRKTL